MIPTSERNEYLYMKNLLYNYHSQPQKIKAFQQYCKDTMKGQRVTGIMKQTNEYINKLEKTERIQRRHHSIVCQESPAKKTPTSTTPDPPYISERISKIQLFNEGIDEALFDDCGTTQQELLNKQMIRKPFSQKLPTSHHSNNKKRFALSMIKNNQARKINYRLNQFGTQGIQEYKNPGLTEQATTNEQIGMLDMDSYTNLNINQQIIPEQINSQLDSMKSGQNTNITNTPRNLQLCKKMAQSQITIGYGGNGTATIAVTGFKDNYNTKQYNNSIKKKSTASSLGLSQTQIIAKKNKGKQILMQKVNNEIVNRFRLIKGINIMKGIVYLEKQQFKQYFHKAYKNCHGVMDLINAFTDHLFKDRQKIDVDQFKQYFMDELATENQVTQLETAFTYYENLAYKRTSSMSFSDQLSRAQTSTSQKSKI